MADEVPPLQLTTIASAAERMFPTLQPEQIERAAAHGHVRRGQDGEVLVEAGATNARFFIIKTGHVEIVRPPGTDEHVVALLGPGQFTGEASMLSGRRGLVRLRMREAGELIELEREQLLALVQTDSELSDIFMRAFILRRVELIAHGFGDAVLIGSPFSQGTLRVKEFLTRNGHPYTFVDLEKDSGVQELLDRFGVAEGEVPVLICRQTVVLRNPTNLQIADCLGFNEAIDTARLRDIL